MRKSGSNPPYLAMGQPTQEIPHLHETLNQIRGLLDPLQEAWKVILREMINSRTGKHSKLISLYLLKKRSQNI